MGNIRDKNRTERNQEAYSQDSCGIARSWERVEAGGSESEATEPARGTGTSAGADICQLVREVWRAIPRAPSYEVSCFGRVRRISTGHILTPRDSHGYLRFDLSERGKLIKKLGHVLVLEAFVGLCPPGMEARHVHDRTRSNCALWNLAWGSKAENGKDRIRHGSSIRNDLAGSVFGELTVLRRSPVQSHNVRWICRCSCGQERTARGDLLIRGKSWSCASCAKAPSRIGVSP